MIESCHKEPELTPYPWMFLPNEVAYISDYVAILLKNPEFTHPPDWLRKSEIAFLNETLEIENRVKLELSESKRQYTGRWYCQGFHPTCLPWSLVNACGVLGVEPDSEYLANLLDKTAKQRGNTFEGLGNLDGFLKNDIEIRLKKHYGYGGLLSTIVAHNKDDIILNNGLVIKYYLNYGLPLLVSVCPGSFYSKPNKYLGFESHAICISGYEITADGYFNVQIIDSNLGIIWVSLEHLSISPWSSRTFSLNLVTT